MKPRPCLNCGADYTPRRQGESRGYCSRECYRDRNEIGIEVADRWKPEPPPELPESIDCPKCDKAMHLDLEMDREGRITGNPTRRWWCVSGHSHYYPPPIALPKRLMCGAHSQPLPCIRCEEMSQHMKKLRAARGGAWNKGKHSGNVWATSA